MRIIESKQGFCNGYRNVLRRNCLLRREYIFLNPGLITILVLLAMFYKTGLLRVTFEVKVGFDLGMELKQTLHPKILHLLRGIS